MTLESAHVARSVFLRVGVLARFPAVLGIIDAGEGPWVSFTAMSTPPDRRRVLDRLVPGFTEELIATRAAEERLARWIALGRPTPSRRVVARDLVVLGLDRVRRTLVSALRRMPPCVAHHLLHHIWILGVQRGDGGWMWDAPPRPPGPLQLIALDGKVELAELWSIIGHESAHGWLLAAAPPDRVKTIHERKRTASLPRRLAIEWRRPDLLVNVIRENIRDAVRVERQAAALARSWRFVGPGADADLQAECARWAAMRLP
jgi:hypothetical protein